jgi:endonuclease/exonuclease/phosphatase (EEP) superfamily protein YafD
MSSFSKRLRSVFARGLAALLWLTATSIIALLIFSCALPQDLTRTTAVYTRLVQIAFFGRVLTFHLAILLAGITAIALPLRRWRLCVLSGVAWLIAFCPSPLSLIPRHPPPIVGSHLRLMSMNLKYTHADPELIVDQIRRFNPDVLLVEDYTPFAESALARHLGSDYPHRCLKPNFLEGLAIYSRRPFEGEPTEIFTDEVRQMRGVIKLDGSPLVIYLEHPFSPRSLQRIIGNRRATAYIAQEVMSEQDPVIVAGDFNFTSSTPNAEALQAAGLRDAFDLAGHGRGSTWPVEPRWLRWLPGFRIDHVYVSRSLSCKQFFVGEYDGSDHPPIVADVGTWRSR